MISELKKIEKKNEIHPHFDFYEQISQLGLHLNCDLYAKFDYRGKLLELLGIPENFTVFLNGELVCECVDNTLFHKNMELLKELCL